MTHTQFDQLIHKMQPGSQLLRAAALQGGISAQVTAVEVEHPDGQIQKMIVRVHGDADFNKNPNIAADEFKLLQILRDAGITAPQPYYLDPSSDIFGRPYLVMEFIEGTTDFDPAVITDAPHQIAAQLARIHRTNTVQHNVDFLPKFNPQKTIQRPAVLDDSLQEGRIREALEKVWPLPGRNALTLLHGDFWPGNILWRDGQIVAMIDWEDAVIGDPLLDLGNGRMEILWSFGADFMHEFTHHYQTLNPIDLTDLPYWDLRAALRPASLLSEWAPDAAAEQRMRESHHQFVAQAFQKLSEQDHG